MQWLAIITMLIDHIGYVWFPDAPIWRIIGRMSFPIYAYYVAVSMSRTSNRKAYVRRLLILALMSQVPFSALFHTWTVNVIGTFFISVAAIYLMERSPQSPLRFLWIVGAALLMETISFDYGAYGLLLVLIYRYTASHMIWIAHAGLNILYIVAFQWLIQVFSMFPSFVFTYASGSASRSTPRWLWRAFYPAHLLALFLLTFFIPAAPQ